jgi:hypothetical protein
LAEARTGPHPHPATHAEYPRWVAGWGRGLVRAPLTKLYSQPLRRANQIGMIALAAMRASAKG